MHTTRGRASPALASPLMLLKKTTHPPTSYNARAQWPRAIREGRVKRCGTCTFLVPEGDIVIEDGAEHCPMCKDTMTAEWKSNEENSVAQVKSDAIRRLFQPPQFSVRSLQETIAPVATRISGFRDSMSPTVMDITASTPLPVPLGGTNTAYFDMIRYTAGSSTITPLPNNNGISLSQSDSNTRIVLTITGNIRGIYSLVFIDHVYRYVVVR